MMRIVEAVCLLGAVLCVQASFTVRCANAMVIVASFVSDQALGKRSTYPFREHRAQGLCIAMSILPIIFSSQLLLKSHTTGYPVSFLFKLSIVSAIVFLIELRRRPNFDFICDKWSFAATAVATSLVFSYFDIARGITLVFIHHFLVHYLIYRLSNTFTLGEAYVVAFLMASAIYNGISNMIVSMFPIVPSWFLPSPIVGLDDPFMILSQYSFLAVLLIIVAVSPLIPRLKSDESIQSEFWARFVLIGCAFDLLLLSVLDIEPIYFVVRSVFSHPARVALVIWWVSIIGSGLIFFKRFEKWTECRLVLSRKLYHFLIASIIVPGIVADLEFLAFALVVALSVFMFCEIIRIAQVSDISFWIQQYMDSYIDSRKEPALVGRDSGPVILSHIYLLIGCSLPVWLHLPFVFINDKSTLFPLFAGVLSLGVCDSIAASVGVRYGKICWPGSRRTLEGSLAAFFSVLISLSFLHMYLSTSYIPIGVFALQALGLSLMEASVEQVDDLFLPLYFYAVLNTISL